MQEVGPILELFREKCDKLKALCQLDNIVLEKVWSTKWKPSNKRNSGKKVMVKVGLANLNKIYGMGRKGVITYTYTFRKLTVKKEVLEASSFCD